MDTSSLAAALVGAQMGQVQLAVAAKMLQMDTNSANSVVQMIDAAQKSMDPLANVAAGIGTNLDISI